MLKTPTYLSLALVLGQLTACSSDEAVKKEDPAPTQVVEEKKAPVQKSRVELARDALPAQNAKEDERFTDELRAKITTMVNAEYESDDDAIKASVAGEHRKPSNLVRDAARHPVETLSFFGLKQDMTVVEMGAGGGWYTEVLAPVLAKKGTLLIGAYDPASDPTSMRSVYGARQAAFLKRTPEMYSSTKTFFLGGDTVTIADDGTADMVIAIREMHNWQRRGQIDAYLASTFKVLKVGGIFGVVQHRGIKDTKGEDTADSGYLSQEWLVAKIKAAGFELVESSEVNANGDDMKVYEKGVWTLPPGLRLGDTDRAKYEAIGESDRMTLKFKKPAA